MKTAQVIVWIGLAFVGGLGWGLWLNERSKPVTVEASSSPSSHSQPVLAQNRPNTPGYASFSSNESSPILWQKYTITRREILQGDSQLAAEYKELQGEISTQREKLDGAMIKVDPKVAAIVAKIESVRQQRLSVPITTPLNQSTANPASSQ